MIVPRPAVTFGLGEHGNFDRLLKAMRQRRFVYPGRTDTIKSCGHVTDLVGQHQVGAVARGPHDHLQLLLPGTDDDRGDRDDDRGRVRCLPPPFCVPLKLMLAVAQPFGLLEQAHLKTGINKDRIMKLVESTNVYPNVLVERGYEFRTNLRSGIELWARKPRGACSGTMKILFVAHEGRDGIGTHSAGLRAALPAALADDDQFVVAGSRAAARGGAHGSRTAGPTPVRGTRCRPGAPAGFRPTLLERRPTLLTVHDVCFLDHPDWFPRSVYRYKSTLLRLVRARGRLQSSASPTTPSTDSATTSPTCEVRSTSSILGSSLLITWPAPSGDEGYFLTLSTIEPRKNHLGLLEAFQLAVVRASDFAGRSRARAATRVARSPQPSPRRTASTSSAGHRRRAGAPVPRRGIRRRPIIRRGVRDPGG